MVTERSFRAEVIEINITFENDLGMCRHFQVDCFTFHQLHRLLAQKTGEEKLIEVFRQRQDAAEHGDGFSANGYCYLQPSSLRRLLGPRLIDARILPGARQAPAFTRRAAVLPLAGG